MKHAFLSNDGQLFKALSRCKNIAQRHGKNVFRISTKMLHHGGNRLQGYCLLGLYINEKEILGLGDQKATQSRQIFPQNAGDGFC